MSHLAAPKAVGAVPEFKLWLSCPGARCVFGQGKWRLLDAIRCLGSLQAAAASVGISYRKAWGDLRAAEKALSITFLDCHRGGSSGGETRLTAAGLMWLREFQRMHAEVEKSVEKAFAEWNQRMGTKQKGSKR
ncbi:MAG TPA: hypothetical protein VMZ06_04090 [Candidatus Bathyarchaeia archaeon]|nr:hypothetical protein [Candidatus Bathyarchaeia archaeon]